MFKEFTAILVYTRIHLHKLEYLKCQNSLMLQTTATEN